MTIETLKTFVQSANINFLIGSGLSCPFLQTLGNIEKQLTALEDVPKEKRTGVKATLYREYFEKVIVPNLMRGEEHENYSATLRNYKEFLIIWNAILHNRCTSLMSKQANIYSTNIDLMVENAVEAVEVEFNDGFIGSVKPVFNEANFQKTIRKESTHFHNSTELPVFNLLKMHGSVNWKAVRGKITNDFDLSVVAHVKEVVDSYEDGVFPKYNEDNAMIVSQIEDSVDFSEFIEAYNQFQIVNPTKQKFSVTVMDVHFYELIRMFSNSLEKENSMLFVMGFSFADEHIRNIVRRALKTNPTLLVVVFAFKDAEEKSFSSLLGEEFSNLTILTPSKYSDDNDLTDDSKIDIFDFKNINKVFKGLLDLIPVQFGDGR